MADQFKINTTQAMQNAQTLEQQMNAAKRLAQQIDSCKRSIVSSQENYGSVNRQLEKIYEAALEDAAKMSTFKGALETIAKTYEEYEQKICGQYTQTSSNRSNDNTADTTGEDKRNWFQKLWDFIFGDKRDKKYSATTSEQQQAADQAMKDQIASLMHSEKYSKSAWKSASLEERKNILRSYLKDLEKIMGIDVSDSIDFFNKAPENGYITNGSYNHTFNNIHINEYNLTEYSADESYSIFTTLTHEMRHAYQRAAVNNPTKYCVDKATIDAWSKNFKHYISGDDDYNAYRDQPVESDARAFAGQS